MKLPLRYYNDPILRKQALPIEEITPEIKKLAHDMIETMIDLNAAGLAAPQIGKSVRLFVIRDEKLDASGRVVSGSPEVFINPHLSKPSKEKVGLTQGCFSIPGIYLEIIRPKTIHVRYQNLQGEWKEELLDDFRAQVVMHENDHINGVLMIDRIPVNERKKLEPQLIAMDRKYHK